MHVWPSLLTALGTICLALLALVGAHGRVAVPLHPSQGAVLVVGAILNFTAAIAGALRQHRVDSLTRQLSRAETEARQAQRGVEEFARLELAVLARDLGYFSSERLSLFAFVGPGFELVARFTHNPTLDTRERRRYPLDYGCLGQAWKTNRKELVIPARPSVDAEEWAARHEQTGIPAALVPAMTMKSRTVIALRINEPGFLPTPLGVIVVESERTYRDEAVGGVISAELRPQEVFDYLVGYNDKLAAVLAVFGRLTDVATSAESSVMPQ